MIAHPLDDLGAYALGALEPAERRRIEAHLDTCVSCRADLATHDDALWAIAESAAATPPARLRDRIVRDAPRMRRTPTPLGRLVRLRVPVAVPLALAAVLAVAVVGLASARRDADAYGHALAGVASGRIVSLAPADASRARGALVVPASGQPYLVLDLATPPAGRTWEAWVVRDDHPIAAGLADVRGGIVTIVLTEALAPGDAVAVTLEDLRGALRPTSAPVLIGKT